MPDQFVLEKIKTGETEPYEVITIVEDSVVLSQRDEETGELVVVKINGEDVTDGSD